MSRSLPLLILAGLILSCSSRPAIRYADGKRAIRLDLSEALKEPPKDWKGGMHVVSLGRTKGTSHHLVWIKTEEGLHAHIKHDLTVRVVRGYGTLTLGGEQIRLREGDMVTIPRGVAHRFVNESREPAAAYVVISPPFDGKDHVTLTSVLREKGGR